MFCTKCGTKLPENSVFCSECGTSTTENSNVQNVSKESNDVFGWGILGFFIPLAGLILYLTWKTDRPKASKAAGIGALVCLIFNVVIIALWLLIMFVAVAAVGI